MKSIKQQFKEFRSSTPKHVQWLLLGAAFVVVIILLVLIIGGKSTKKTEIPESDQQASFSVTPDKIDLSGVVAGETKNQNLTVTVNMPVVIDKIKSGVSEITTTNNCDDLTDTCLINVIYKPTKPQDNKETKLEITWHVSTQKDIVNKQSVTVVYGAIEDSDPFMDEPEEKEDKKPEPKPEVKEEKKPEPVEEKKPEPEEEPVTEDEEDVAEEEEETEEEETEEEEEPVAEPVKEQIKKEIDVIAPKKVFKEPDPEPEFQLPPENCSDFAIPGYDKSGTQIGWIKPEGGANYFHPFSDKDCSNPTGKYDFKTGVITSLEDGSRMGTDADHIGYRNVRARNLSIPQLSSPETMSLPSDGVFSDDAGWDWSGGEMKFASDDEGWSSTLDEEALTGSGAIGGESVTSSRAFDRTFVLRQFKPIPATIVSEVRADPSVYGCSTTISGECDSKKNHSIPVRATVDRNVYSDNGRTIIIPTGTLLMGYLEGDLPGPYQAVGRMNIKWYQFILPNGVEFNFKDGNQDPYSGDAQGRVGVPGHGSTDYMEQMVMPILTSLVPAAVNMIAPIADTVVNQINLDSNTIVQSGTMRSSEMAKQTIIDTWNKVAQKLLVDVMSNTTPPFSIAAGTRINVFSPVDLIVSCNEQPGKKCTVIPLGNNERRPWSELKNVSRESSDPSWVGQARSFNLGDEFCAEKNGRKTIGDNWAKSGYDYRTVYMYCESLNYESINMAKNKVYSKQTQAKFDEKYGGADREGDQLKAYNEDILGLSYNDDGDIINPWEKPAKAAVLPEDEGLKCDDGTSPDADGCCTGETFTDMGEDGWNCCPDSGGDCFPPLTVEME